MERRKKMKAKYPVLVELGMPDLGKSLLTEIPNTASSTEESSEPGSN